MTRRSGVAMYVLLLIAVVVIIRLHMTMVQIITQIQGGYLW